MAIQEIGDRAFALHYEFIDQQIGVILGGSEVLVVDSRSTESQANEIARDIRRLTHDPISIVVNTHYHWDHTWGNHALRPATMWGHVRTAERMREDQSEHPHPPRSPDRQQPSAHGPSPTAAPGYPGRWDPHPVGTRPGRPSPFATLSGRRPADRAVAGLGCRNAGLALGA